MLWEPRVEAALGQQDGGGWLAGQVAGAVCTKSWRSEITWCIPQIADNSMLGVGITFVVGRSWKIVRHSLNCLCLFHKYSALSRGILAFLHLSVLSSLGGAPMKSAGAAA